MNVMLDLKIAFVIVGLIIAFGIFFYNPMVYHARMLKLRKEVEDLRKAVKILALQVDLQMLTNKVRNSEETEKVPEESKEQPKD